MKSNATEPCEKRRRTSPEGKIQTLAHLPHDQLIAIANYLHKTSRALFAVALTAPSESWRSNGWRGKPSEASKVIISSVISSMMYSPPSRFGTLEPKKTQMQEYYEAHWEVLDFVDVEESLAKKLTDDDIGSVLVCINARDSLKKLRLIRCHKFVGQGLEPLRGSVVLEHIDIGGRIAHGRCAVPLWRYKRSLSVRYNVEIGEMGYASDEMGYASDELATLSYKRSLSEAAIIPILDSIIDADGNTFRKLDLPEEWKTGQTRNEPPLLQFLEKFNPLMLSEQSECENCSELCRLFCEICFTCFKRVCDDCIENFHMYPTSVQSCGRCSQTLCDSCGDHAVCETCNSVYCSLCADIDDVDAAVSCGNYRCSEKSLCLGCRSPDNCPGCESCQSVVWPKLVDERDRLAEETKQLRKENHELRKRLSSGLENLA
eukprot:CAMPEP_0201941836 /NCGR_PEP_ID=MMETSP0903-20130614/47802_1 /ASSEMBLY_ACC=CAM_ASM_000552 /TAXON_ID=420261 /ORGANISM="Thalassiosira antarctica, Strain CCMP982" /LENGTH=430 /DNA_ID=CAMNT_0048484015 /DNA_START=24 /DNA_END=1316 /DNA_ORIENTATION=-